MSTLPAPRPKCHGIFGERCDRPATQVNVWRDGPMPAPAFWYYCDQHARRAQDYTRGLKSRPSPEGYSEWRRLDTPEGV